MTHDDIQRSLAELHPASAGWALSCCRWDREEAEEVLQMAYLKILDGRARSRQVQACFVHPRAALRAVSGLFRAYVAAERRRRMNAALAA